MPGVCLVWLCDYFFFFFFFFQAEDGIRDWSVTGVQTCALPIWHRGRRDRGGGARAPRGGPFDLREDARRPREDPSQGRRAGDGLRGAAEPPPRASPDRHGRMGLPDLA